MTRTPRTPKTPKPRFRITLEAPPIPGDQDGIRLLTQSWRQYALRYVIVGTVASFLHRS